MRGEQFPRKINAIKCQTGPAASTDFKGVSSPLSNRRGPPGSRKGNAALGVGAQHGEKQKKADQNLPPEYSASVSSGAISWAELSYDEKNRWLVILNAADRAGWLPRWAGDFLHEIFLAGDDETHHGDIFSLDALVSYCVDALGIVANDNGGSK